MGFESMPCRVRCISFLILWSSAWLARSHEEQAHEDHGHEEPGHDSESSADLSTERCIAAMTLGSVAFQMSLFYLINHRDPDMKRYALAVIGQTISIFCSVLTFSASFQFIESYLSHASELMQTLACPGLSVILFLFMELIVTLAARARRKNLGPLVKVVLSRSTTLELGTPAYELNAKTSGAFAAQMCAASVIRGFGHLQGLAYQAENRRSMALMCLVCPLVFASLFFIAWLVAQWRACLIHHKAHSDGVEVHESDKALIRIAEECEDEVIALSCGFHGAVAARVMITGALPHVILEGLGPAHHPDSPKNKEVATLFAVGIAAAILCVGLNIISFGSLRVGINMDKLRSDSFDRILRLITQSMGMMFGWCMIFCTNLFALSLTFTRDGLQLRLTIALVLSFATFLSMTVLDFVTDLPCSGPAFDKALGMIIYAEGAAVGLAWEHAFEKCAEVAVEFMVEDRSNPLFQLSDDPHVWALCLSGAIVLAVLPAYRFYIAPRMYHMIEEHEGEMMEQEALYRRQSMSMSRGSYDGQGSYEYDRIAGGPPLDPDSGMYIWQGQSNQLEMANGCESAGVPDGQVFTGN